MFIVKFSSTALNFDYDFVLLVLFLGRPVCIHKQKNANAPGYIQISVPPNWNKAQLRKMLQFARNFAHLCEMLLKYEQYFVQSSNISCNWARSFYGLTSVNNPSWYWGIEILKMSQSWFFFCATYTKMAFSKKWQSNWLFMAREDQYRKYCRMQSLTNLC